jgi:PAS domain S-box-containing protein
VAEVVRTVNCPGLPSFADELAAVLVLHDPETGAVLDANAAATDLYGYSPDELTTLSVAEFSSESSRYSQERAEELIRDASEGDVQVFDWQIKRKDGALRWVTVRLEPITLDGTEYVMAEQEDITELKTRTRRLRLLYRIIRHNLRNDMTVVMGHAESLESTLEDGTLQEQAGLIREVARKVGEMTESVGRIEEITASDATDHAPTDLVALLEELAGEYEREYPAASVRVEGDGTAMVSADGALRFAFENAIDHSEAANPEVVVEIDRAPEEGRVTARMTDDCPPIPDMEVEALDLETDISAVNHATGVGLFVMKWCTESLGGGLEIRREDGGNVVEFTFSLYRGPTGSGEGVAV